jgi:hypothetical protein
MLGIPHPKIWIKNAQVVKVYADIPKSKTFPNLKPSGHKHFR